MLLFELETELRDGRSPTEVRDLLLRLKRRDDLLAKVDATIDEALENLENKAPVPPRENPAPEAILPEYAHQKRGFGDFRRDAEPRLCPKCGTQAEVGPKFCGNCGGALGESSGAIVPVPIPPLVQEENGSKENSKSCRYRCAPGDAPRLIADVKVWLDGQGFDSQEMNTENKGLLLQIKKRGGWRRYFGMATSLNILFQQSDDTMTVEIGAGKWIDNVAGVGYVGMIYTWPLAGYGAWEQMKMPEKVFDYIATRIGYK